MPAARPWTNSWGGSGLEPDRIADSGGDADIGPLMRKGVLGVAHRTTGEHYFDWHHTPADTPDKVDPIELRKNVAALILRRAVTRRRA